MNNLGALLINEPPLQVLPTLAVAIGLSEAMFIQQTHYRLRISKNERDGRKWVYDTYEDWQKDHFPFWSISKLRRVVGNLEDAGLLLSTDKYNKMKIDKTKWYSIDYERLSKVIVPSVQNEQLVSPKKKDASVQNGQGNNLREPKNTQKTTTTEPPSLFSCWETIMALPMTPHYRDTILDWEKDYPYEWIVKAMKEAADQNVRRPKYVQRILENWQAQGRISNQGKPDITTKQAQPTETITLTDEEIAERQRLAQEARKRLTGAPNESG